MIFSLRVSTAHLTCLSRVSTKATPVFDESLHLGVRVMHNSNTLKLYCKQKCLLGAATFIFCAILLVQVTPQIQIPDSGIKQTGRQVLKRKYVKWKEQSTLEMEMEHCSECSVLQETGYTTAVTAYNAFLTQTLSCDRHYI